MNGRVRVRRVFLGLLAVVVSFVLAACGTTGPGELRLSWDQDDVTVTKTAKAFLREGLEYDWSVEKIVVPGSATIAEGDSATFAYTVEVTRDEGTVFESVLGVAGNICATNHKSEAASNVVVTDFVEYQDADGVWHVIEEVETAADATLAASDETCFDYEIVFEPVQDAVAYRNRAEVTLLTSSGEVDRTYRAQAPFELPDEQEATTLDETAELSDVLVCPDGFSCTVSDAGPWTFTASGEVSFTVTVTNDGVGCGEQVTLVNTATLTEGDTNETRNDSAEATITTGECEVEGGEGCTPGYWKQPHHFDSWTDYDPTDMFDDVFGADISIRGKSAKRGPPTANDDPTLLEALEATGGGESALARHAVAALLNAAHPDVSYAYSVDEVIEIVQEALSASGDLSVEEAKNVLAAENEMGCPLN